MTAATTAGLHSTFSVRTLEGLPLQLHARDEGRGRDEGAPIHDGPTPHRRSKTPDVYVQDNRPVLLLSTKTNRKPE
jgi:hypothetical protein